MFVLPDRIGVSLYWPACCCCVLWIDRLEGQSSIHFISVHLNKHTLPFTKMDCFQTLRDCSNDCCCKCYLSLAGCKLHVVFLFDTVCAMTVIILWLSCHCDTSNTTWFKPLWHTGTSRSCPFLFIYLFLRNLVVSFWFSTQGTQVKITTKYKCNK